MCADSINRICVYCRELAPTTPSPPPLSPSLNTRIQGQLLEGVEYHIYLYCFTFDDINLNRAFVIIVLFPKIYSNKKVCANDVGKLKALGFYWYNFFRFNVIINATFSG